MLIFQGGRGFRKNQRRIKNAFVARPCRFHRWRWYDCALGVFTLALLVYSLVTVILVSIWINDYRTRGESQAQHLHRPKSLESDIETSYYYHIGIPLAISLLVALFYLLILTVLILIWMRYLRNLGCFVILLLLILIGIIFFLTIGGVATRKACDETTIELFAFDHVTRKLKQAKGMNYANHLYVLSHHGECCGIRNYQDWKIWNPLIPWPHDPLSVPNECCQEHSPPNNVLGERNECQNIDILNEPQNSVRLREIHTRGCGYKIWTRIQESGELWKYVFHGLIIGILLFILLLLLLCFMWRIFGREREDKWVGDSRRDQDDFTESDIIPGTPSKSMMSESENTFYAP